MDTRATIKPARKNQRGKKLDSKLTSRSARSTRSVKSTPGTTSSEASVTISAAPDASLGAKETPSYLEFYFDKYLRHERKFLPPAVWSVKEIADWLGYSERTIEKIINNHADFPAPVISGLDLEDARWFAQDILAWVGKPSSRPLKIR
jgi:hypothetical protein